MSAPYEGSGVVYIYFGQERDSSGSVVNPEYAQVRSNGVGVAIVSQCIDWWVWLNLTSILHKCDNSACLLQ